MVVLAHQDDESTFAGIVQRLGPQTRFLWVTNGDGLSDELGMPDADYAALRQQETVAAMALAGVGADRLTFLGYGEKEIYARLASLDDPSTGFTRASVLTHFRDIAARVRAEILAFRPDIIFTHAWQGGQPEHDLTHLMAVLAARAIPGCAVFEVPEYELAYTVFLRFPPWRTGQVHEIALTGAEMAVKKAMVDTYRTQRRGMVLTRALATAGDAGALAWSLLSRRRLPAARFAAREHFATVPPDRNYRTCPHGADRLEYIGDHWQKRPILFSRMIVPIVCALEQ